ncbi:cytochrome c biogenesis protein CcsA [Adlercreutzia sp. ZJ154]|uniref:cytochrome c biogenesis protein CcsA n=1 Tax=Adlercreutzia sp. ZJ154 TaxID=2709790 RepID=UPI0013EBA182|nr:cytochrome c biogenesis protein CcsA [Adlercreutzia sp. ZJ154]
MADSKKRTARKLPEAGQWPDALSPWVIVAGIILTTLGFLMAFFVVPPVSGATVNGAELVGDTVVSNKLLMSQKIFYFHMPVAITSFAALAFAAYYCVRFLITRELRFDTCARIAMEVALLFTVMTMITGEMWTRFEWGVWWTWDPRLTTYLILMLIVIAYIVLRNMVDDPIRRAAFASVVGVIAFIDVPICFMVTRLIPSSVHPVVTRAGGMTPEMGLCIALVGVGMMCVAFALYRARFRQVRFAERVDALKERLDD